MTTNTIDNEILNGLKYVCDDCPFDGHCSDCYITLAEERIEKYSNYLETVLCGTEATIEDIVSLMIKR